LYVREKQNMQKRLLQAAASNLALLLRTRERRERMQDAVAHLSLVFLRLISAMKRPE
jgi:hypothetical protein